MQAFRDHGRAPQVHQAGFREVSSGQSDCSPGLVVEDGDCQSEKRPDIQAAVSISGFIAAC